MQDIVYEDIQDNDLVELCISDDSRAWEEILRRYKKRIFNISYQFVDRGYGLHLLYCHFWTKTGRTD